MHLPCKILSGRISSMSTKSPLYFHEKELLKRGRRSEVLKMKA